VEALSRDYEPLGVRFLYVYKALAHPELNGYVQPVTLEERLMHVAEAKRALGTEIIWLADNMENDLKHALGDASNSEFIVDPQGDVVVRRLWSDPAALRVDLARLVGPVAEPTSVADLDMPNPEYYRPTVATGVVARVELSGRMMPVRVEITASKDDLPAYAKLRAEADAGLLQGGTGTLYLGFHLDPLYQVHWNNLAPQPEFAISAPTGTTVTPGSATFPDVEVEADADPREFLIEVRADDVPDEPLRFTTTYYACDNDNTWCVPVTQSYSIWLTADPDGGRVFGRGAGGRIGPGRRQSSRLFFSASTDAPDLYHGLPRSLPMTDATEPTVTHARWDELPQESLNAQIDRRMVTGQRLMVAQVMIKKGGVVPMHSHENEQLTQVIDGALRFWIGSEDAEPIDVRSGEILHIPSNVPHKAEALEDTNDVDVFTPPRQDWLDGTDSYLRGK